MPRRVIVELDDEFRLTQVAGIVVNAQGEAAGEMTGNQISAALDMASRFMLVNHIAELSSRKVVERLAHGVVLAQPGGEGTVPGAPPRQPLIIP